MGATEKKINIQAAWEELGIANDFLFGKVMQDAGLCKGLLERIFPDMKIDHVEYPAIQKGIHPDADAKSVRLDVYVIDDVGTVYDIEMQVVDTKELPKRTRYYQAMMDLEMIDKGQPYKNLKQSFVIFICPFDLFGKGRHIYTFENICRQDNEVLLGDGTAKIFLNTEGTGEDVSRELRAFLDYVGGRKTEDPFVQKLEDAVKKAKQNREWRHEYMTLLMRDQENVEKGIEIGRAEGRQEGRAEGRQEGRAEGRQEGRAEGRQEGKIYGAISVYRDLGMSDCDIIKKLQQKFHLPEKDAEEYLQN